MEVHPTKRKRTQPRKLTSWNIHYPPTYRSEQHSPSGPFSLTNRLRIPEILAKTEYGGHR
jgi:hypothetical protein